MIANYVYFNGAQLANWLTLLWFFSVLVDCEPKIVHQAAARPNSTGAVRPMEAAASEQGAQQSAAAANQTSYKIVATGWPLTSPMWPTLNTQEASGDDGKQTVEPFIYADEPRKIDYSLILSLNKTIIELIKNSAQQQKQIGVNLSFEYYFNHDQHVETTPPAIKIEIDRSEFRFLKAGAQQVGDQQVFVKSKMWVKFNERIKLNDFSGLENADWLKFSLVNRRASSLVAIRRLRIEFIAAGAPTKTTAPPDERESQAAPQPEAPPAETTQPQTPATEAPPPPQFAPQSPTQLDAGLPPGPGQDQTGLDEGGEPVPGESGDYSPAATSAAAGGPEQVPQASNPLASTIQPVAPKRSSWAPWGRRRRRKRQAAQLGGDHQVTSGAAEEVIIQLVCYKRDACEHWRAAEQSDRIQWSLARMPPTIGPITRGYHYVSNLADSYTMSNGGDPSELLRIELNETEQVTNLDRNSGHCVEVALYATERARLKLYRMDRAKQGSAEGGGDNGAWTKGQLLLWWAPTVNANDEGQSSARPFLPGAQMAALNQSGWTFESICFDHFFANSSDCGRGQCALAFQMSTSEELEAANELGTKESGADGQPAKPLVAVEATPIGEQVVGVAILREFAVSVPKKSAARWLQSWQRPQVAPNLDWRYYPESDYSFTNDNVSLVNLFHRAHYFMQSDWIIADEGLDFSAILSIEAHYGHSAAAPANTSSSTGDEAKEANQAANGAVVGQLNSISWPAAVLVSDEQTFRLKVSRRLVNTNFETFSEPDRISDAELSSRIDWPASKLARNSTEYIQPVQYNLSLADLGERIQKARLEGRLMGGDLFKIVIEVELDCKWAALRQLQGAEGQQFRITLSNVSLADRCFPSPCQFGECSQRNGTKLDDWDCQCDKWHRGRRCEFGRWCEWAHVPTPSSVLASSQSQSNGPAKQRQLSIDAQPVQAIARAPSSALQIVHNNNQQQQAKSPSNSQQQLQQQWLGLVGQKLVNGSLFCHLKLGSGSHCSELDVPLNNNTYDNEGATFACSCKGDQYLSDDGKCRFAHPCNSIVCPEIGQFCDESKPFEGGTGHHCQCNERLDWHADPMNGGKCSRRQCTDKLRDCGFAAHVCLPTLPGERPICKCGPKFVLRTTEKGKRECQSAACVLPTLNDCHHICLPDNSNLERPWQCACHAGYALDKDQRTCRPVSTSSAWDGKGAGEPQCKPACDSKTQLCTDLGCKCKQGFVPDGELSIKLDSSRLRPHGHASVHLGANSSTLIDYTQSVRCLNVCSLSYAENKDEFEKIESVCPLGLCEPATFQCRCSDPSSSALVHTKYEPIWTNETEAQAEQLEGHGSGATLRRRSSPLCHLKRVCRPESASYQGCRARGAICVPDYTKPAMFDCVCPPSSEKRLVGQAGEFVCEPRCSSIRQECLKKQAVCRPIDKDQVRCDCLPGMMMDKEEQKCYLARYSYSMNLLLVNKYYEPEWRFHRLVAPASATTNASGQHNGQERAGAADDAQTAPKLQEIAPQFQRQHQPAAKRDGSPTMRSIFVSEYNQCNITQVIPKSIIEDPYEHDMESYLGYIDQCNERLHESIRTYDLNSRLAEDLRQSLRQHLTDFTVTTNHSLCQELRGAPLAATEAAQQMDTQQHEPISYLNCTIFLQSMAPVDEAVVAQVFSDCDQHGADKRFCWIKPRLLLAKSPQTPWLISGGASHSTSSMAKDHLHFRQIVPCELEGFCGEDTYSVRHDDNSSLCSCKCPADLEMIDLKELEPRRSFLAPAADAHNQAQHLGAVKEICAPRNRCSAGAGANGTAFCLHKPGSICQYDVRSGSRCQCVYPAHENNEGHCVEVTFNKLDGTLIAVLIVVATCLAVSLAINLYALTKAKRGLFGHSKQYPLHEFPGAASAGAATTTASRNHSRPLNRSTGMPNLAFNSDED